MVDVFLTFFRLGLTSFGGPIAHIDYFRREFVDHRGWLNERLYGEIVAFCSILPGPTSSQVGLIVGLLRAGPGGALAAWLGFTLPSAVALALFAAFVQVNEKAALTPPAWLAGLLAGLGAAATAVVAQAVSSMAKTHCPNRRTQLIAAGALIAALALGGAPAWQWAPIAGGALAGIYLCPQAESRIGAEILLPLRLPQLLSVAASAVFVVLAVAAIVVAPHSQVSFLLATVVRAGALVFGGGHVVLPLLQSLVPAGLISSNDFYAGYGATQAMPGPVFTFAAFLGLLNGSALHGVAGAVVVTVLIFMPSFLLVFALLPVLGAMRTNPAAAGALRGANASVVGVLGALLYSPLILTLGSSLGRVAIALTVFTLIAILKTPPWIAVLFAAIAGASLLH